MKRIQVCFGKVVIVSDELAKKAEQVFASSPALSREQLERAAAAEPRGVTVNAGPASKIQEAKHSGRATWTEKKKR